MGKLFQGKVEKGLTSSSNQVKQRGLTWLRLNQENDLRQSFGLKKEKVPFKVNYKEQSFKDLDTRPHYPISSAYRGFSFMGGKSNKCRYA